MVRTTPYFLPVLKDYVLLLTYIFVLVNMNSKLIIFKTRVKRVLPGTVLHAQQF